MNRLERSEERRNLRRRAIRLVHRMARRLFADLAATRPDRCFHIELPEGRLVFGHDAPAFTIRFTTNRSLAATLAFGSLGFGDAYMRGDIEIEGRLQELLAMAFEPAARSAFRFPLARLSQAIQALTRLAGLSRARKNVKAHYDLDTDFFTGWLDDSLAYSCGYYESDADDLATAQRNKYRYTLRKLRLNRGESLVDVGCGWGGLMFYAAERYDARCTGYTLSEEQYRFVDREIARRGLGGRVTVHLDDYRNIRGQFDKLVSIGMFEHVGRWYYDTYFRTVRALLKPGGIGLLHTIGSTDGKAVNPWLTKHIFPGAHLPTLSQLTKRMATRQLWVYDIEDLRIHYARTLDQWAERFEAHAAKLGLEESFIRMWRLYLNGCSVAFKVGENHLFQALFSTEKAARIPLTRSYLYMRGTVQPSVST